MNAALSISLSGMMAQQTRAAATASNIANARTSGTVGATATSGVQAYQPLTTQQSAVVAGGNSAGTVAVTTPSTTPPVTTYSPDDANANADGLVAMPDVDEAREATDLLSEKVTYSANAKVTRVADDMMKTALDIIA
ncbi:flagellar basal body rod protein FlgC [Radicibacter daui]|uniref:flagellar basal body rod protein FlgC n=1 Tax=Radicibacter daui TaxID=3064829 RepID=UPI004046D3B3